MKLIVVGSPNLIMVSAGTIAQAIERLALHPTEIVTRGQLGADREAEEYASNYGLPVRRFLCPKHRNGPTTRNKSMTKYADVALVFSGDDENRASHQVARFMGRLKKKAHVVRVAQ